MQQSLPLGRTTETDSAGSRLVGARLTAVNVHRAWWIVLTTTSLSAGLLLYSSLEGLSPSIGVLQWVDILGSCAFLVLLAMARAGKLARQWHPAVVYSYAFFFVLLLDAYFVFNLSKYTGNISYFFGVLTPSVLLLLQPAIWIPFLLINHALYVAYLTYFSPVTQEYSLLVAGGTAVTLLACLVNGFLYRSKHADLIKEVEIARRNRLLAAINANLESRTEEIEEIMAIAAHDLRAPLHSLKTLYEMAVDEPAWKDASSQDLISASIRSCNEMLGLVNGLLDAHRADHSLLTASPAPADMLPVFRKAADNARLAASTKEISLETTFPDEPAEAAVVEDHLQQVLDNLLSNAIKYSPSGAVVNLALRRNGSGWIGEVSDNGPGISEADRERVFHKFQRGTNRPTGGEASSGLGLFIARKMIRGMNGTLDYIPRKPSGSIFRLELPAIDDDELDLDRPL